MGQRDEPGPEAVSEPEESRAETASRPARWQTRALIDEGLRKCGLIWLTREPLGRGQAFWHAWVAGRVYLLTGPGEQPDPQLADGERLQVVVRSKDNVHRLLIVGATGERLLPGDNDWQAATTALAAGRLNLSRAEQAPARWADDPATVIYRLTLRDDTVEGPGNYADGAHRAAPATTTATTAGRSPSLLHRHGHRRRALS